MGIFDEIVFEYPLPGNPPRTGWQTKDTPAQWLDLYKIDADGRLWHEAYDVEDQSDPNATGINRLLGAATAVNQRWEPCAFRGCIEFYCDDWELSALFDAGKMIDIKVLQQPNERIDDD